MRAHIFHTECTLSYVFNPNLHELISFSKILHSVISQKSNAREDGKIKGRILAGVTGFVRAFVMLEDVLTVYVVVVCELWLIIHGYCTIISDGVFPKFAVCICDSIAWKIRSTHHAGGTRDGNCC
jgi:hypothetical protein